MARLRLTKKQRNELTNLTRTINQRILRAEEHYRAGGKDVLPREIAFEYQVKEQWHSEHVPISYSTKFDSMEDYQRRIKELRQMKNKQENIHSFTKTQRDKTIKGIEESLNMDSLPPDLEDKIRNMSPTELSEFWGRFSEKARRLGLRYSSEQAMRDTMEDIFPEDKKNLYQ